MARDSSKRPNNVTALAANGLRAVRPVRRAPARMGPLAVLPIFARLGGRFVLVAGSGEGAAWKAELLAAAGADVLLVRDGANEPHCREAREIAARNAGASSDVLAGERTTVPPQSNATAAAPSDASQTSRTGTVRILPRPWTLADLSGATVAPEGSSVPDIHRADRRPALALIDTECHAEAASFAALARDLGVTVNAIDKPEHCDVLFGSVVNRSPVVVGISTDGAAPVLGQAIRRRVEALLPLSLADWAGAMARARSRVLALLPERAQRRAFFERFADAAQRTDWPEPSDGRDAAPNSIDPILDMAGEVARATEAARSHDAPGGTATSMGGTSGHVTLVGAGPGDAELLTLKAVRALQSADVILFDALVSADVLELARREARRMLVGKRASRESCRQEDINATMLKLAREGRRVVRLKSGDPMIFGRAGEEIEALQSAGIPHDVVPGVTSAQALAASLGLSLTHRERARSVRFVTGHGSNGRLPDDLDWRGLADPATTLVIYMGARTAPLLADRLLAEGMAPATPATAASAIARPEQRVWQGTLQTLGRGIGTLDDDQPILIALGEGMRSRAASRPEECGALVA